MEQKELTAEQRIFAIKESWLKNLVSLHNDIDAYLKTLPLSPDAIKLAGQQIYLGMVVVKEAIMTSKFDIQTPKDEVKDESKDESVTEPVA